MIQNYICQIFKWGRFGKVTKNEMLISADAAYQLEQLFPTDA